ncbi:MAG: SPOR domain-containing protein, partial [Candidatus Binatia bacterium]
TRGKADQSAAKAAGHETAEVKTPRQDPAGTKASGTTTSPPASQPAAENVIATAKKPVPAASAGKSTAPLPSPAPTGEVKQQPTAPASGTSEAVPQSKALPVEQPQIAAPAKVPIKDKSEKTSPEGKAPGATAPTKTDQAPAQSKDRRPEVKAEPKDAGSTNASSEGNYPKTQAAAESGIASTKEPAPAVAAEKPAPPPENAEPAREVKPQTTTPAKDASLTGKQTPLQPKAIPAEPTQMAAPSEETTKEWSGKARVETKPRTESAPAKEVKESPRHTLEQARAEIKVNEPAASKDPAPKAEPAREATLRKDLSPEVSRPGAAGSAAPREEPELPKDSPAKTDAVAPKQEVKGKTEPGIPETKTQADQAAGEKPPEEAGKDLLALKSVEGYVIQISFPHKTDAQEWSHVLSREGYTTSITSIGEGESVRLRVGSFPSQALANNLLARLKKEGLNGFVVQVPKG